MRPVVNNRLQELQSRYAEMSSETVFRNDFAPFKNQHTVLYESIPDVLATADRVLPLLSKRYQDQLFDALNRIVAAFAELSKASTPVYGERRGHWLHQVDEAITLLNNGDIRLGHAILFSGLLSPISTGELADAARQHIQDVNAAYERVSEQAHTLAAEAENRAKQIVEQAKATARGESLKSAQAQFSNASASILKMMWLWGVLAFLFTGGLIAVAIWMYVQTRSAAIVAAEEPLVTLEWPTMISLLAVKLFILSTIAFVTTLCWRTFRAYVHMRELNEHRIRVANSADAFMAAADAATRNVILLRMMEAVVAFGNSGLLPGDEDTIAAQKLPIDSQMLSRFTNPSS